MPLDPRWGHRAPDPITLGLLQEGAISGVATPPLASLATNLKQRGSKGIVALGGVQGQSPWPSLLRDGMIAMNTGGGQE